MNCERARELFSDYLEGSMDPALAAVIRDHLDKCPDCAREFGSFKVTWSMLSILPDIEPPRDLRHDVVMRAVRMQQERAQDSKRSTFSINWDHILSSLIPMRPVGVAVAAAALAFLVLRFPQQVYHGFTGMFNPRTSITQPVSPKKQAASASQTWISRELGRNTVWVSVTPDESKGQYSVRFSMNKEALKVGEASTSLPASITQLPANDFDFSRTDLGISVFSGDISEDRSVEVPCMMDETNSRAGTTNLLVVWEFGQRQFGYVVFVPTHRIAKPGEMPGFSVSGRDYAQSESGLYAALQGMAEDYGVPIVVNSRLTERPAAISLGRSDLKTALNQMLKPVGLDWVYADGAIYVDRK